MRDTYCVFFVRSRHDGSFYIFGGNVRESQFQAMLVRELKERFPGCIVMKNDAGHNQGIPDISILFGGRYAVLECKRSAKAPHRPNQDWFINHVNDMGGVARFIYPENKEEVLDDLESAFRPRGKARVPQPK